MILATHFAHITAFTWESLSAILVAIGLVGGFVGWYIARKDKRQEERQLQTTKAIADSIDHLSEVLMAKLETKEAVARISERLARVEGKVPGL